MRRFARRLSVIPFQAAMAFLVLGSGLVGLLNLSPATDALTVLLPTWLVTGLNVTYALAGLGMLIGVGRGRRDIEGGGLVLLMSGILVRLAAVIIAAGFVAPVLVAFVFYAAFLAACVARLSTLVRNQVIVKIANHGTLDQIVTDIEEDQLQVRDREVDPDAA